MPETDAQHRPLVSGIEIKSGKEVGNQLQHITTGTLTGLATRTFDNKKVLVPTRKRPWIVLPVLIGCVAILWLAAACGDGVAEFRDFEEEPCEASLSPKEGNMTTETESPEDRGERIHNVRLRYDDLFWRQPNVRGVSEGFITDENGSITEIWGILIDVTEKVDQNTLPPENRIPDCLEGVPVQMLDKGPIRLLSKSLEGLGTEESNARD